MSDVKTQKLACQTLTDEPFSPLSASCLKVSCRGFMEFKYRNTAPSLAKCISLVFPDVIEDLHTIFLRLCGYVCEFFVFHHAEVVPPMLLHYVSA